MLPDTHEEPSFSSTLGRYELLSRLGTGGMAEVWSARVTGAGGFVKLVAVKRMLPHLARDEKFCTMFLDEGRLAANISSPHVVETLDLGRSDDGTLYLVMELVPGVALHRLLSVLSRDGVSVPVPVAVEVIAQAARGLDDAHQATTPLGEPLGIVHRDVSPQNVLVGADGRVRITDFGVARAILRNTHTTTGELKGKLSYFAPEMAYGDVDCRADVFSLGVVAWETLTGRRLFAADNPMARLENVRSMRIPDVREVRPEVPEAVAAVVAEALLRDRDRRIQSAGEFAQRLRDAIGVAGITSRELGAYVRGAAAEDIQAVELGIRRALEETSRPFEVDLVDPSSPTHSGILLSDASRPGAPPAQPEPATTSWSQAGPTGVQQRSRRSRLLVAAVLGLVAIGVVGGILVSEMIAGDPVSTPRPAGAVDERPPEVAAPAPGQAVTVEATSPAAVAPVAPVIPAEPPSSVEDPPVEDPPLSRREAERERRRLAREAREARRARPTGGAAATSPAPAQRGGGGNMGGGIVGIDSFDRDIRR